jgi:hypothetical protein
MTGPEDTADQAVDDVEDFLAPDDDSNAGEDMAADNDPDVEGNPGLPPEGDDPMDGAAPSG